MPKWAKIYLLFILINWLMFTAFRLVFLFAFRTGLTAEALPNLWRALGIGAQFDGKLAAVVSVPFGVYMLLISLWPEMKKWIKKAVASFYGVAETVLLLVYFVDFGHYEYINIRISSSVFRYFDNADTSLQMLWESYPFVWATLALAASFLIFYKLTYFLIRKAAETKRDNWKIKTAYGTGLFLLTAALIYGQVAWYPLRWSNAYFSSNAFISNLALNPVLNLYDTYRFAKQKKYDKDLVIKYYPVISDYLGVDKPDIDTLSFERDIPANPKAPAAGFNVVIILMESFAWNKTSFTNTEIDPTPFAKELAKSSVLFDNFFTPTSATARAVFATLVTIPDVTSYKTSTRNPLIVNQHMIANAFDGYEKMYFIGGSASWGNIRGVIKNNIEGVRLYEEGDFDDGSHEDVWGLSDLDLFINADKTLAEEEKPFLAVIQTSGFHRPYTIPEKNAGFKAENVSMDKLQRLSFKSLAEYNSLRFSDHVLGEFFKLAKEKPYYDKTVFFIMGDHGLAADNADNLPRGYQFFNLINHQVPLIVHAPKVLKPAVIHRAGSQIDVMPMAAGITGTAYRTSAMGRDLFDPKYKDKEGAFIFGWASLPHPTGFLSGDYFYHTMDESEGLYKYADKEYYKNLKDVEKEKFEEMKAHALGIYETSKYMLYNNPKK